MYLYQCPKCNKMFAASNPKVCPYCKNERLMLLSQYRVHILHLSDIKSKYNKYSIKFTIQSDPNDMEMVMSETLCNILKLPSISIRHTIDSPYERRIKRTHTTKYKGVFETPLTVELRVYSPNRAYVLLDSEDDEIFDYLVTQYKQHGWKVLDLRKSSISFVRILKQYLSTHVIPRLKNEVIRKDITCLMGDNDNNNGGSSDDNNH